MSQGNLCRNLNKCLKKKKNSSSLKSTRLSSTELTKMLPPPISIWAKDVINVKSDNSCYQQQDLRTSPLNAGNYTSLMSMHFLLKFSKKLESIFCIVNLTQIKKNSSSLKSTRLSSTELTKSKT